VERAAAGQQLDQRADLELARQVLLDRVLDVDRDPEQPRRELRRMLVADGRPAEEARQALLARDLDDERAAAGAGEREAEGR
jgi:hypothetical protein